MKFASYLVDAKPTFGALVDDGVIDVPPLTNGRIASLREALAANALADIARLIAGRRADRAMPLELLPLVADPQRIVCVGINYRDHAAETGATSHRHQACSCASPIRSSGTASRWCGPACPRSSTSKASLPS
jgi:2-keto-4-pentenoate hydratase/2-oxohepta-3-ene-1,7-dioic acid hydratase in catechol pathway